MIGFGSIGQAVLPLLFRHISIKPDQLTIVSKYDDGMPIAKAYGVQLITTALTPENYQVILKQHLRKNDFLLNLSVNVSSIDLIKLAKQTGALYLDTCLEPWEGGYVDPAVPISLRSNYSFRLAALSLNDAANKGPTAVITHGANPGLVSHFVKQALLNLAADNKLPLKTPITQTEWAKLAAELNIKVIHIAERDTQTAHLPKKTDEFVNTWSVDGFVSEGSQPAELGWGSHERHWPHDARHHETGNQCAIYLNRPGASTRVRTWTPLSGAFHGFLITHGEAISIANYFSLHQGGELSYRPTVHYAYHPCEDAILSLHELAGNEWIQQSEQRLLFDEIVDGRDELGVLLMGNPKGAYWFGSQLSIHEARKLAPHNNATSLQVAISVLAGMLWAIEHPEEGIIEPDQMDFDYLLKIAMPYLGKVEGHYTDWTPLKERERLFKEDHLDYEDPWQFINLRVS
ncbi:MAG: homospermidine synthase [Gammaproteobacteria bacterium RIFCSPHIGHO2_12_FULL_45_12]|nr:MAG: homospermidine synthase [Gammaproteobacteria bacterium RIFCSPHIGHO2_12_FULL_45_12]